MATVFIAILIIFIAIPIGIIIYCFYYHHRCSVIIEDYIKAYNLWADDIGRTLKDMCNNGLYQAKLSRKDVVERAKEYPIKYIKKYVLDNKTEKEKTKLLNSITQYKNFMNDLKQQAKARKEYYIQSWEQTWKEDKYFSQIDLPELEWDKIEEYKDYFCFYFYSQTKDNKITQALISMTPDLIYQLIGKDTKSKTKSKVQKVIGTQCNTTNGFATEEFKIEQRKIMGRIYQDGLTLRDWILKRDNYTCVQCGNSIAKEPNLLLKVDHIHPVSKWGPSVPANLQTLCWKCNRAKSNNV